jgi:hypothetical protein
MVARMGGDFWRIVEALAGLPKAQSLSLPSVSSPLGVELLEGHVPGNGRTVLTGFATVMIKITCPFFPPAHI